MTFPFLLDSIGLLDTTLDTRGAAQPTAEDTRDAAQPIAEVRALHDTLRTCEPTSRATEAHRVTTFRATFAFRALRATCATCATCATFATFATCATWNATALHVAATYREAYGATTWNATIATIPTCTTMISRCRKLCAISNLFHIIHHPHRIFLISLAGGCLTDEFVHILAFAFPNGHSHCSNGFSVIGNLKLFRNVAGPVYLLEIRRAT